MISSVSREPVRRLVCILASFCAIALAQSPRAFTEQYCTGCHNQRLKLGELVLEGLDPARPASALATWERVIRKLRAGAMPPAGLPKPPERDRAQFIAALETRLDAAARERPDPGRPPLHRLNRAEYANAIRDLLDLEIDAPALLPPDDSAFGFDNISDVLGLSPSLQERYLAAASNIASLATGNPSRTPASTTWRVPQDLSQNRHIDGMPLGTMGGIKARYNFPLDGEYELQAKLYRTNLNIMRGLEFPHDVEFTIGGERVHLARIGGTQDLASLFEQPTETGDAVDARMRIRVNVKAGPREVTAAFLEEQVSGPARLQAFVRSSVDNFDWTGWPHIQTFTITGPFNATGPGDTPARRKIFTCKEQTPACARQILSAIARRAYRRPLTDDDLARITEFFEIGRKMGGFERGIEAGLERILASPNFVFRAERDPQGAQPGSVNRVSDLELASRLSFFLWSSIPDDALLDLAARGRLKDPATLEAQVRRMLRDPKSRALIDNFAGQWLQLRNVRNIFPNSDLFPDFDENLRRSMRQETELLFENVLRQDRSVLELLTADYTFLNDRLAQHYGIPGIHGSHFRSVPVTQDFRRGLLGHASILSITSKAERTSPVVRGKWILENLLGMPVPPPPADVPPLPERKAGEAPRSMREQMVLHRANVVCANCHKIMDPVGLALENFDAVGAWRTIDGATPVDASAELADGTKINGVVELRNAILSRPEMFAGTVTEKLLTYALGRGVDHRDMPAVRAILRDAAPRQYRFQDLILGVVRSTPFQMRTAGVQ